MAANTVKISPNILRRRVLSEIQRVPGMGFARMQSIRSVNLGWMLKIARDYWNQISIGSKQDLDRKYTEYYVDNLENIGWDTGWKILSGLKNVALSTDDESLKDLIESEITDGKKIGANGLPLSNKNPNSNVSTPVNSPVIQNPTEKLDPMEVVRKQVEFARNVKIHYVMPGFVDEFTMCLLSGRVTWLVGSPGTGKTLLVNRIASMLNPKRPVVRVNITEDTTDMALIGSRVARVDAATGATVTEWQDGPVLQAMQMGLDQDGNVIGPPAVLLVDEWDAGNPGVMMLLQRVTEMPSLGARRSLMVGEDGGRVVQAHPDFSIVLTSNTKARGDSTGRFAGTKPQNGALIDRISATFEFSYPDLMKVYKDAVPTPFLKQLNTVWLDIQESIKKEDLNVDFSLRKINDLIFYLRCGMRFSLALRISCLNAYEVDEASKIEALFEKQFPKNYVFSM